MRIDLIKSNLNTYKANLHCHSVISDGSKTPEQLVEDYKKNGYSVLSITDHNVLIDHSDLNQKDFLLLTGYEANIDPQKIYYNGFGNHSPTVHICFIARDPKNDVIPLFNPKYCFSISEEDLAKQKYLGTPDYERAFNNVNGFVKKHLDNGFIAAFNHPNWSMAAMEDMITYEGFYCMEICNYGCYNEGYPEINDYVYEQLLRHGKKMFAIATDDNHNRYPDGHPHCDSYGGFTMIQAESLTYDNIIKALENGDFYASMGPEIKEFYVEQEGEDWIAHIKTSPVREIAFKTYGRRSSCWKPEKEGDTITEARFKLQSKYDRYLRVYITDEKNRYAWTNAYFDPCKEENGKFDYASFMY